MPVAPSRVPDESSSLAECRVMRIHIGTDHAGFELKNRIVDHLKAAGHDVVDHGAHEYDAEDDYPPFCFDVGEAVVAEAGSLGVRSEEHTSELQSRGQLV